MTRPLSLSLSSPRPPCRQSIELAVLRSTHEAAVACALAFLFPVRNKITSVMIHMSKKLQATQQVRSDGPCVPKYGGRRYVLYDTSRGYIRTGFWRHIYLLVDLRSFASHRHKEQHGTDTPGVKVYRTSQYYCCTIYQYRAK